MSKSLSLSILRLSLCVVLMLSVMPGSLHAGSASILADFEAGFPDGWFAFFGGSTVDTTRQVVADTDALARPGQVGDNGIATIAYNVFDFGGFGQDFEAALGGPQNWINFESFDFWFYGTGSGLTYQAEISDNRSDPNSDTSERFDYGFTDSTPGWQYFSIPFSDFTRATDFQPGGAPDDGFTLTEIWAWAIVLPQGADTVHFDDFGVGLRTVDDFESGLPFGTDGDGNSIGFYTFVDPSGSTVAISTTATPPAAVPGSPGDNNVLQIDSNVVVGGFAGVIHAFENAAVDTWTPQDWSTYEGICFWLYGNNTGSILFLDILDNRSSGSTTDDAERFSIDILDDFSGWQFFEIPFTDFARKEIGNGAPNDGFTLTDVHGWGFGIFSSGQAFSNYIDDVGLWGEAEPEPIPLEVSYSDSAFGVDEGDTAVVTVKLSRPLEAGEDPAEVMVTYYTEAGSATPDRDYLDVAGTLTFVQGGSTQLTFDVPTLDDTQYEGTETVILRLTDPVGASPGFNFQSRLDIFDNDPYDPLVVDDFEGFPYLWQGTGNVALSDLEIAADDPLAIPGQGPYERVLSAVVPLRVEIDIADRICNSGKGVVPVVLLTTPDFDATTVDHTTVTLGEAYETHRAPRTGELRRHEEDADRDGDIDLVFHFRYDETGLPCEPDSVPFNGFTYDGQPITGGDADARFGREFPLGRDWSVAEGLRFWYYGQNTGDEITLELLDNRAPDPGPPGWVMRWQDEFNGPAGMPPNPAHWDREIGDGTVNSIPGWGNSELQYYTDEAANAAMDGQGNLAISAREADGSLICYYGPCEYTSARLLTRNRSEFAYGRIEARIKVADGEGLWPAFWSLGTNIREVGWPQAGEIDFMEFVGRQPFEIFGTIHGPGYSGGASFGNTYTFSEPVADDYHTFTVEWQPDQIFWYVDGIQYHQAAPSDVAPNEWVFNNPFYFLLNVAVGGNFGGPVGEDTVFPQTMLVDYVRVYSAPDTAERFETLFVDNFSGWQEVTVPFTSFVRSDEQPAGAPDDGLTLNEVWGYGFALPQGSSSGYLLIGDVRLIQPDAVTVVNLDDDGVGSLRRALAIVTPGGMVDFDPSLAGGTIGLTSGPLTVAKSVTIDGSTAPGLTVSGGGADRVMIIDPTGDVSMSHLAIADGYGWQLAGGILNNGGLVLDHVTVTNNVMATDVGDFWQGGGGIYNGGGATLMLIDSSVVGNTAGWSGGGVYSFFDTSTTVVRSTIAGNTSSDVGGGFRLLGNAEIVNSTISGNESTGWYGGALFGTDGIVNLTNTTVADNISPSYAPADLFVGTFGPSSATLTLTNTLVSSAGENCVLAPFGSGVVTLTVDHNNVFTDGTCSPGASDAIVGDPLIGPLADNGGPTLTHALQAGSPAIDFADGAVCPATDQRGVARPQGAGCDTGSFESDPVPGTIRPAEKETLGAN